MLSRLVRIQLVLFGTITAVALSIVALNYVQIPAQLGVGRVDVLVQLDDAAGLYPKSNVTYRGTEVGQVTSVDIRPGGGVVAKLQIDDSISIPADSVAQVRSASVIGEQYVNFVPPEGSTTTASLAQGDVVPVNRTTLPTSTTEVLNSVDEFVTSIPTEQLTVTLDELGKAFDGSGDDLGALIDSGSDLVATAQENLPQTVDLIENTGPVLQTQKDMDPNIRSFVSSLDSISGQLKDSDADLRTIFTKSQPFLSNIGEFGENLNPVLGDVLTDAAEVGQVADAYRPAIEHIITLFPALETAFQGTFPLDRDDDKNPEINLWFKLGVDPPVCNTGFADANNFQNPDDFTDQPVSPDSYCKPAKDSKQVIRGARNAPCPNSTLRGAYAADCGLIFNKIEEDRRNTLSSVSAVAAEAGGGAMLTPNGTFFLLDQLAGGAPASSWEKMLLGAVGL